MMMLQAGVVGLPNVGKSTLFNALTASHAAESANYPFCTIEPNTGVVKVPDPRLKVLQPLAKTHTIIPAIFEFVDIAGLVRGASQGEGLGNQFLAHIREVDLIVQVVRCFEDENIHHVDGSVNPSRDIDTIHLELCMADVASLEKRIQNLSKRAKSQDKEAQAQLALYQAILPTLQNGETLQIEKFSDEEQHLLKQSQLLSSKPVVYAGNVTEEELANPMKNPHYATLVARAKEEGRPVVAVSAQLEAELMQLEDEAERLDYLASLGIESGGVDTLIRATYELLGLWTYFTAGEKEVRAWPFPKGYTAPQCAGVIHSDFERGFICAEVIGYQDYVTCEGEKVAKEKGLLRQEGKSYVMQDGDVVHFRFNV